MQFTENETLILNRLQRGIPPVSEPFKEIAGETGIDEIDVISTVNDLKQRKIIRNISGIFNAGALGYHINLVAFQVREKDIDKAAQVINSHPGVSHNYLRGHKYNIWFTLAEESEENFNRTVSILSAKSKAEDSLILKNEKLIKIGVFLKIGDYDSSETKQNGNINHSGRTEINDRAREAVRLLQVDLPVEKRPFLRILDNSSLFNREEELLGYFSAFLSDGIMRRYAAVLRHVDAGYGANAMTVWKVKDYSDAERFRSDGHISHLYLRTVYPGRWEYPLFAMIHAKSKDELGQIIENLSRESGIDDYLVLESIRELKKQRVRYYSDEFKEWKNIYYD